MSITLPFMSADEAARLVNDGDVVGMGGFTPAGAPKEVPTAIAHRAEALHAEGKPFKIGIYTGASTGDSCDGMLARAHAISFRTPYQSSKDLRTELNKLMRSTSTTAEQLAASAEELTASSQQSAQASEQVAQSVTNAAGAANPDFNAGELMLITDHLNVMMAGSPLIGLNDDAFGVRFPDMSEAYNLELTDILRQTAKKLGIILREGVYCASHGPEYETPAEVRLFQKLGADAVGMSTVPEVVVANHMNMKVAGISCLTNKAAGLSATKLSHAEVMECGRKVAKDFVNLLREGVRQML